MKLLICLSLLCQAVAFAPIALVQTHTQSATSNRPAGLERSVLFHHSEDHQDSSYSMTAASHQNAGWRAVSKALTGLSSGLVTFAGTAAFAGEEIEMAELPPPWVPAVFAVVLLIGVGVLTGSLGNVMDEEASLGLQSGARARKEIERSKSSYFKKR